MMFADRGLGLAREQHLFIGGGVAYGVTTLYFLQQQVLRRLHRAVKRATAVAAAESPIVLFLLLFSSGTIPWPTVGRGYYHPGLQRLIGEDFVASLLVTSTSTDTLEPRDQLHRSD